MKSAVQVISWISVVVGGLAVIGGVSQLATDPSNAYYSLLGGVMFATQGIVSLVYVHTQSMKVF